MSCRASDTHGQIEPLDGDSGGSLRAVRTLSGPEAAHLVSTSPEAGRRRLVGYRPSPNDPNRELTMRPPIRWRECRKEGDVLSLLTVPKMVASLHRGSPLWLSSI